MITQQLLDYIAQEIQLGVAPDAIQATLRSNGWIEADIEQAFRASTPVPQSVAPSVHAVQPVKTEFFIPSEKKKSPIIKILLIVAGLLLVAGVAYAGYVFTSAPSLKVSSPTTNPIPEPLPVATSTPEIPLDIATTTASTTPSLEFATSTATTTATIKTATGTVSTTTTPTSSTSTKAH